MNARLEQFEKDYNQEISDFSLSAERLEDAGVSVDSIEKELLLKHMFNLADIAYNFFHDMKEHKSSCSKEGDKPKEKCPLCLKNKD